MLIVFLSCDSNLRDALTIISATVVHVCYTDGMLFSDTGIVLREPLNILFGV